MKNLVLIGGGGHCSSVIDVIEAEGKCRIIGILDTKQPVGTKLSGYEIIGTDDEIETLHQKGYEFLITVGHIKDAAIRIKLYEKLKACNAVLAKVYSPLAHVSKNSSISEGTVVMHHAIVNSGSTIGNNCIINTKSLIEHDCCIGDHCHVSTAAVINGNCSIADNCFIGSRSVLIQGIKIARSSVVGAGTVVLKDILKEKSLVVGNPGKIK